MKNAKCVIGFKISPYKYFSREDFLRIPELAINPLGDRIVHAFFNEAYDDRINFRQFMRVLSRFRPVKKNKENKLNSREEKLRCKLSFIVEILLKSFTC